MWTIICVKENFSFPTVFHSWREAPWVRDSGTVLVFVKWWSQWCCNMGLWLHLPRNSSWPSGMQQLPPCCLVFGSSCWFNPVPADGKSLMAMVGREPKCLTLQETAHLLPGVPGRSQQVWGPFAVSAPVPPGLQPHFPGRSLQRSSRMHKGKDIAGRSSASFLRRSSPLVHCQLGIDLKSRMTGQYTLT